MKIRWWYACGVSAALGLSACGTAPTVLSGEPADASDSGAAPGSDAQPSPEPVAEAGTRDAAPAYPAFRPSMPQILTGGSIIAQPTAVNVSFMGDPLEADIDTFASAMGKTTYWADRTKEYGIAPLTLGARIHDPTVWPATTDDSAIQAWLVAQLAGDAGVAPGWPAPDKNSVYVLYFPPGVTVTYGGSTSCVGFHGYHGNVTLPNNQLIAYAVISRCDSIPEDPSATGIQYVSADVSHELLEAITDPFVASGLGNEALGAKPTGLGYAGTDPDHIAFEYVTSEELMDMCTLIPDGTGHGAFYTPMDSPYLVQRGWSNAAASQWKNPCLPVPAGEVYIAGVPVLPDSFSYPDIFGVSTKTRGVKIPVGGTKTIEIHLWSDAPTAGPWVLEAFEAQTKALDLSQSKKSGQNGDTVQLTIKVKAGTTGGSELVVIFSELGTQGSFFPFIVLN